MKRHAIKAFLLLACLAMGAAVAHVDMGFPIAADGAVGRDRIPAEYGPLFADIRFSGDDDVPVASVTLRFNQRTVVLPRCLTKKLRSAKLADVMAAGSWWHEGSRLPPYIYFAFYETGRDGGHWGMRPGHYLMFDLRNGKLIEMTALLPIGGGTMMQPAIDVERRCSKAELRGLMASRPKD
jgi:hypothetical protein